jgi:hypothetical protein
MIYERGNEYDEKEYQALFKGQNDLDIYFFSSRDNFGAVLIIHKRYGAFQND